MAARWAGLLIMVAMMVGGGEGSEPMVVYVTDSSAYIAWDAAAERFKASYREQGQTTWTSVGPGAEFMSNFLLLSSLSLHHTYQVQISAKTGSSWNDLTTLNSVTPVNPPLAPTLLHETSYTETSVAIAWFLPSESDAASTFKASIRSCYKKQALDLCGAYQDYKDPVTSQVVEVSTRTMSFTGLKEGFFYDVYILARNLNKFGYVQGQIEPLRIRPRPALWTSTRDLVIIGVEESTVYLAWKALEQASSYCVQYRSYSSQPLPWSSSCLITSTTTAKVTQLDTGRVPLLLPDHFTSTCCPQGRSISSECPWPTSTSTLKEL